jgi:lipopolysaccharide/colanic/teichoic acid biosynthesis glycosyltransferase
LLARRAARGPAQGRSRRSIFGSRTLIVGTGAAGQEVLRRLRTRIDDGYDVQGFIDTDSARIGERVSGMEILGSLENVGKVIDERRITDVIFSTEELPYGQILSVIGRSSGRAVNFRLVPNSLEAIIGKTRIDDLDTLPLVEIDYGIRKLSHRFVKRVFDLAVALPLFLTVYPLAVMLQAIRGSAGNLALMLHLPSVLKGAISLIGLPLNPEDYPLTGREYVTGLVPGLDLGPKGLTGLVQLNARADSTPGEVERYVLYYAKNQSLLLDLEILLKSVLTHTRKS